MKPSNIAFTLAMTMSTAVFADSSPVATTGLFTLSATQVVQLNVLNLDNKDCTFDFDLLNIDGIVLTAATNSMTVKANTGSSAELLQNQSLPLTVRVQLDFTPQLTSQSNLAGCGKLIPTLEIKTADSVAILITDFYGMPSGDKSESYKVKLCHKPGTSAQKTLEVAASAFKGHQSHGDKEGSCENLSDDHNHDDKGKNKD